MMFHEAPAELDGIHVWRIGRQKYQLFPFGSDQLLGNHVLVDAQIVYDDKVAGIEFWAELFVHEGKPAVTVERAFKFIVTHDAVLPNGANNGEILSALGGTTIDETFAPHRPAILGHKLQVASGLVDEDQPRNVDGLHPR